MQQVFKEFETEIKELREHIFYIKSISNEIDENSKLYSYISSITKKKFNYKSLIISLYGIVESFSEKFVIKYLENISILISEYPNLKKIIQNKNIYNSALLALKVIEQKSIKYNHLKENEIIENLYSCINNDNNYILNYDSFTMFSGNLKHQKICDLFTQIGIDLNTEFTKKADFNLSNSENQFKKLDELVEMRNEVAHGNINQLLNPSEIEEYVEFIEKYFTNLFEILEEDLNQEKLNYWIKNYSIEIEDTSIFKGNILGFNNFKNLIVTNESEIIVEKGNKKFKIAKVIKIKNFDNNDITIKLEINSTLRKNQKFHLKR